MVKVRNEIEHKIRIPQCRPNEHGRAVLRDLAVTALEYIGTPLIPYAILQELQRSNHHEKLDREVWNLLAAYYSSPLTTDSSELKRFVRLDSNTSGSVVRRHIKQGMHLAFASLAEEAKFTFSPEERKHIADLKDRYAPVYKATQRKAVGRKSFRQRQAELRRNEDPDCLRRQKTRETNAGLADDAMFQQSRRETILTAMAEPEVRRKISDADKRQWRDGVRKPRRKIRITEQSEEVKNISAM